jgi:general secretion pathway protein K
MALSFSRESYVELAAARNGRNLTQAYFVARAGIAATVYELWKKRSVPPVKGIELQEAPNPIDLGRFSGQLGEGFYDVEIQDESGKISVNNAPDEQLRSLMAVIGIEKPDADVIVDSILDWRDADNLNRMSGAEDDYYQSLRPPYRAKNNAMDTIEELLLVRGVTPDYFYGRQELGPDGAPAYRFGLSRCLTAFSSTIRINVNYAPLQVLLSIPGLPPEAAQMIYERRLARPFKDVGEITKELPATLGAATMPYLSTGETGVYTLTSYAHMRDSRARRVIRAVIRLDIREPSRYKVIYWNENVPNL